MQANMKLFDQVKLLIDVPAHGLERGQVGAVVDVYSSPRLAYEGEFTDSEGRTPALIALLPEQIAPAWQ